MIGSARAVDGNGTTELRDHQDGRVAPRRPKLLLEHAQSVVERRETRRQLALSRALIGVRVPACRIEYRDTRTGVAPQETCRGTHHFRITRGDGACAALRRA